MESRPTQAVLPLVGLAAEKVIRDRYKEISESRTSGPLQDASNASTCLLCIAGAVAGAPRNSTRHLYLRLNCPIWFTA
ncbi:MAG: hypothetical protein ACQESR_21095 [Planctomycetota bacterium]